ncbi:hypothetical protein [Streptomyces abikoensis]|uniref:HIG1 domain-containing protein n=1 Tax=Streptomyces abikoensis TaxID=97398 RepID=A0ABW7SZ79_9ACTN
MSIWFWIALGLTLFAASISVIMGLLAYMSSRAEGRGMHEALWRAAGVFAKTLTLLILILGFIYAASDGGQNIPGASANGI